MGAAGGWDIPDTYRPGDDGGPPIAAGGGERLPFDVVLTDATEPAAQVRIGRLASAVVPLTSVPITGLDTNITLSSTTEIWLKGSVNSLGVPTTAEITTTPPDEDLVEDTGDPLYRQTTWWALIAKCSEGSADTPGFDFDANPGGSPEICHCEQFLSSHLLLRRVCLNGRARWYPFPWGGHG